MDHNLMWCFGLKDGLRVTQPNERLARVYLTEAASSLGRAEKNFRDGDLLWTTIVVYYAEYYALYSFLQRIGVKCGNHACSALAARFLLGADSIAILDQHRGKRIDAQYYMKVGRDDDVREMLLEAKKFVSRFDETISGLTEDEIHAHRERLRAASRRGSK